MPISEYLLKKTKPQVFVLDILRVGFVVGAPILEGVEDGFEGFCRGIGNYPDRKSSRIVTNSLIRTQFFITKMWQSHNCDRHVIFVL